MHPEAPMDGLPVSIRKKEEIFEIPVATSIPRRAARSVSAVVARAPATKPSNVPSDTPMAAKSIGPRTWSAASDSDRPRALDRSR